MDRTPMRRYEALGDGVFAIVMTLLVLELKLPEAAGPDGHAALSARLLAIWPNYIGYLVSFLFLGLWWLGHHSLLDLVWRVDGPFLWMNFIYLMLITMIPFTASLAAKNWGEPIAGVIYGLNLLLPLAVTRWMFFHATGTPKIAAVEVPPEAVRREGQGFLITTAILTAGIILAFVDTAISFALYGLMAAFYVTTSWRGLEGIGARQQELRHGQQKQAE